MLKVESNFELKNLYKLPFIESEICLCRQHGQTGPVRTFDHASLHLAKAWARDDGLHHHPRKLRDGGVVERQRHIERTS